MGGDVAIAICVGGRGGVTRWRSIWCCGRDSRGVGASYIPILTSFPTLPKPKLAPQISTATCAALKLCMPRLQSLGRLPWWTRLLGVYDGYSLGGRWRGAA
jgi:hypothetical protein